MFLRQELHFVEGPFFRSFREKGQEHHYVWCIAEIRDPLTKKTTGLAKGLVLLTNGAWHDYEKPMHEDTSWRFETNGLAKATLNLSLQGLLAFDSHEPAHLH